MLEDLEDILIIYSIAMQSGYFVFKVKEHSVNVKVGMLEPMDEKYYYCIYYLVLVHFIIYLILKLERSHDGQLSPAFSRAGRC